MGMIANYQGIPKDKLEAVKTDNELLELIEEEQEENDALDLCDIDKMWDALHFILTGISAGEPIENDVLSEAVVGQNVLDSDDFVAWTKAERVLEISKALENLDFENCMKKFDMDVMAKNEIYPNIWKDNDEEKDDIIEDLHDCFESLKKFYNTVGKKGLAVIVSIY